MPLNNITSAELRQLTSIVKRKERVQEELREIESKLSTYLSRVDNLINTEPSQNAKGKRSAFQQAARRESS